MARQLTKKQKKFCDKYLETGNGVKSAEEVYNTKNYNTAGVMANENLKKPKIKEYLESKAEICANEVFRLSQKAKNEAVRLNANKDILDRAGYKPTEKKDITSGGEKLNAVLVKFVEDENN